MAENKMKTCARFVEEARNIVVLTGAGMSTESGIPDFRSKQGLYSKNPEDILSRQFFFEKPDVFYEFLKENLIHEDALPNDGHKTLAKWEKEGKVKLVVTQNVDGLHQAAGSENVVEFHGSVRTATCHNPKCREKYDLQELMKRGGKFYYCKACGSSESGTRRLIKPDVVLFGDMGTYFTHEKFGELYDAVQEADLMIVLGTSLEVYPFRELPGYFPANKPLIIVNYGKTRYDNKGNAIVLRKGIGEALLEIDRLLN